MSLSRTRSLTVLAPAKVNLFLHVTGRLDNGYHTLQSLVAFADIGDQLRLAPAGDFAFSVQGPYAGALSPADRDGSPDSSNLVVRAVWLLAQALQREPRVSVTLVKNLPVGGGIGGGSSDAASVLWALLEWWGLTPAAVPVLPELMLKLGADVPVCFACRPVIMEGIGEKITPLPTMAEMPVVLVNPGKTCLTQKIFTTYNEGYAPTVPIDHERLATMDDVVTFIAAQENMLTPPAVEIIPEIAFAQDALAHQHGCRLARMSGSGATCFGLFNTDEDAQNAAAALSQQHPHWWVRAGTLNRPERY